MQDPMQIIQQGAWSMEHKNELEIAWNSATSIVPGESPHGEYIGTIEKCTIAYHFYKENGAYKYISERIK